MIECNYLDKSYFVKLPMIEELKKSIHLYD